MVYRKCQDSQYNEEEQADSAPFEYLQDQQQCTLRRFRLLEQLQSFRNANQWQGFLAFYAEDPAKQIDQRREQEIKQRGHNSQEGVGKSAKPCQYGA